jgi:hypothetical protein
MHQDAGINSASQLTRDTHEDAHYANYNADIPLPVQNTK